MAKSNRKKKSKQRDPLEMARWGVVICQYVKLAVETILPHIKSH